MHALIPQLSYPASLNCCVLQVWLSFKPSAPVTALIKVPFAWNGRLLADVFPDRLTFSPARFDWYQQVTLQPASVTTGNYFIEVRGRFAACARAALRADPTCLMSPPLPPCRSHGAGC